MGTKTTTDTCHRFDVASLAREGWMRPGSSGTTRWLRGAQETSAIGWAVHGEGGNATALALAYTVGDEVVRYRVPIAWTGCHFGGRRPWFVCPGAGCGRRVAVLYGRRFFLCRHCHDLAYASTRQSPGDRALRKAQGIRVQLGGSANMLEPFPPKPRGLHWRTYARLAREAEAAEGVHHAAFMEWAERETAWLTRMAGEA